MRYLSIYLVLLLCQGLKSSEVKPPEEKDIKFHIYIKDAKETKDIEVDLGTVREIAQRNSDSVVSIRKRENGWELVEGPRTSSKSASSVGPNNSASSRSNSGGQVQSQRQGEWPNQDQQQSQYQIHNSAQDPSPAKAVTSRYGAEANHNQSGGSSQGSRHSSNIYFPPTNQLYVGIWNPQNKQCSCTRTMAKNPI